MSRLRPAPIATFAVVTLVIWGNRVWLNWTNPNVGVAAKLALSVPITCFLIASVAVLVAMVRGVDPHDRRFRALVRAFAAGTVVFWAVRLPMILADHQPRPPSFKPAHAALALVSVVAALWAWRGVPNRPPPPAGDLIGSATRGATGSD